MSNELSFREAIEMYRKIYKRFQEIEGKPWGAEGCMIELAKQVGDLSKHVMGQEHYYFEARKKLPGYESGIEQIADELADIFAQVIRIADHYGIDLEKAHIKAREDEDRSLKEIELFLKKEKEEQDLLDNHMESTC